MLCKSLMKNLITQIFNFNPQNNTFIYYFFPIMTRILSTTFKCLPLLLSTYAFCANDSPSQSLTQTSSGLTNFNGFKTRQHHLQQIKNNPNYDIIVIGGGASGAGVCLDASTRGLKTLVIEKNDFGSGTSSKSTKLIHGGVRYLQQVFALTTDSLKSRWEKFKLVTEAIKERGVLLRNASYMNEKVSFVIPSTSSFYSAYYYIGSVVYYLIYKFASENNTKKFNFPYFLHRNDLRQIFPYISDKYESGVVYQDGSFNDSRLLLTTLLTCTLNQDQYKYLPNGHTPANILNKAELIDFIKNQRGQIQGVIFEDKISSQRYAVKSRYVVNCTGTWSDQIRIKDNPLSKKRICIVGGSHLTYDSKVASSKYGLCLPSSDGRILLVVPWMNRVIVGTTEKVFQEPVSNPTISKEERKFIQDQMINIMDKIPGNQFIDFEKARWTGLRPLVLADQAKSTKDIARTHVIQRSTSGLYSLMGGKWTTYRKMGEDLINEIGKQQEKRGKSINPSISENVLLVGSCLPSYRNFLIKEHGQLGQYLYKTYGGLSQYIVKGDLTPIFGNITKSQIDYLIQNEMVNDPEDILLRRLRVAFLYEKQKTLSFIPTLSRLIIEAKKEKLSEVETEQYIKRNIEVICSYEFD